MSALIYRRPWFAMANTLRDDFFRPRFGTLDRPKNGGEWKPAVDIREEEARFVIEADLPGLAPGDVKIDVEEDVLTLRGERGEKQTEEHDGYRHVERRHGSFVRSFRLSDTVDVNKIEATFDKGVLKLLLPKKPETKPRKIEIQATA